MKRFIAYRITNLVHGKVYIGITARSIKDRWADHKECLVIKGKHPLYRSMNKHGKENFIIEEIAECRTAEDLALTEKALILQYDCKFPKGYNLADGGLGPVGILHSAESREKMRIAHTGTKQSAETVARRMATMAKLFPDGRKMPPRSEEYKRRHSEFMKGRKWVPGQKEKVVAALKGRVFTPEWKAKISAAKKGKKLTEEQRQAHTRPDGSWCAKGCKMPPRTPEHTAKNIAARKAAREKRLGPLLFMLAFFCIGAFGQAHYGHSGSALLADPSVTPGAVRITSKVSVCSIKWGKDERHVTQKMKDEVFAAYGVAQGKGVCAFKTRTVKGRRITEGCEIDHSISRELGGADVVSNLWPQPYTQHLGAHEKDRLENLLHKMVCDGMMSLKQAQLEISHDWPKAYRRYVRKADVKLPR